ncbi:MAG: cytochrome c3 family protein [Anaerolineales bacterium]|nr:cytochrome c3 family protein [Anaerolineales bacterium]
MNRSRLLVSLFILIIVIISGGVILSRAQVLAKPEQPIAFNHQTHVEVGVQCLFCHTSALRSPIAGIPSVQTCMGCHEQIATDNPVVQQVAGYWERQEPIPWVRVNSQPDFVYFDHKPHIGAGLNCESCHGNVSTMDVVRPVVKMDMGWCLNCHLEQPQERIARLTDCLTCHK